MKQNNGLKIYNLFPRVAGKMTSWDKHLDDIKYMGFDALYINPIFETGFSKSLYAPKNFYNIDNSFIDYASELSAEEQLKSFIERAHQCGIKVFLELILTHTAIDSDLLITNPEWYKYENGNLKKYSVKNNERWVEWGDLVELNVENPDTRDSMLNYWKDVIKHYISLGFDGFKCEGAYRIDNDFWGELLKSAKSEKEDLIFIGDNLGATLGEILDLAQSEFDYIFTSFKWWDFSSVWFLEQHFQLKDQINLISFPEHYGTERVADAYDENINALKAFYGIAAVMNSGVMIPIGYEYGCRTKLDVINSFEDDLEDKSMDIRDFLKKMNELKSNFKIFNEESDIFLLNSLNYHIFMFKKVSRNKDEEVLIIANLNFNDNETATIENLKTILEKENITDISPEDRHEIYSHEYHYVLRPGEIRIIYSKD